MFVCRALPYPEEGIRSPGAGVPGGCELPALGAGSRTLDLCRVSDALCTELSLQPSVLCYSTVVLNPPSPPQASWNFKMIIESCQLWSRKGEGSPYPHATHPFIFIEILNPQHRTSTPPLISTLQLC